MRGSCAFPWPAPPLCCAGGAAGPSPRTPDRSTDMDSRREPSAALGLATPARQRLCSRSVEPAWDPQNRLPRQRAQPSLWTSGLGDPPIDLPWVFNETAPKSFPKASGVGESGALGFCSSQTNLGAEAQATLVGHHPRTHSGDAGRERLRLNPGIRPHIGPMPTTLGRPDCARPFPKLPRNCANLGQRRPSLGRFRRLWCDAIASSERRNDIYSHTLDDQ